MWPGPVSWWLDYSALPEREIWARLEVDDSDKAIVVDTDGKLHEFQTSSQARNWLLEDEYSMLENIDAAEFKHGVKPLPPASPSA